MKKIAYSNLNIVDVTNHCMILENYTILVENDKIVDILPDGPIPSEYQIVPCNNQYALPGLINLHAHLFGTGKPSKNLTGGKSQERLMKFIKTKMGHKLLDSLVKKHVKQELLSGTTTVRSMGDFEYSDVRIRNKINQNKILGPRLLVSGPAITAIGGHGEGTFSITSNDLEELRGFVKRNADHGVDQIKICVTGGVMDAKKKGEPGVVRMTLEQTKAICDCAHSLGYKVASHTESLEGIKIALKAGVDTIEHGSFLDEEAVELFHNTGASFIVTTSPALPMAKLDPSITKLSELAQYNTEVVLEGMIEGAKKAKEENITIGLGTDASCPMVSAYAMPYEVYYFTQYYPVTNEEALITATYQNAKILGMENEIGSIEKGKSADILFMDKNPVEDITSIFHLNAILIRGKYIAHPCPKKIPLIENSIKVFLE